MKRMGRMGECGAGRGLQKETAGGWPLGFDNLTGRGRSCCLGRILARLRSGSSAGRRRRNRGTRSRSFSLVESFASRGSWSASNGRTGSFFRRGSKRRMTVNSRKLREWAGTCFAIAAGLRGCTVFARGMTAIPGLRGREQSTIWTGPRCWSSGWNRAGRAAVGCWRGGASFENGSSQAGSGSLTTGSKRFASWAGNQSTRQSTGGSRSFTRAATCSVRRLGAHTTTS